MFHVALWEPEIPPNTGNVARLCAATGAVLHLVGRLGFRTDDRSLKRAGLDYWDAVEVRHHRHVRASWKRPSGRTTSGAWRRRRPYRYTRAAFRAGDCLVFGSESKGLPATVRERYAARTVGIPMPTGKVRSLNLATAAGIVLYEALRQANDW